MIGITSSEFGSVYLGRLLKRPFCGAFSLIYIGSRQHDARRHGLRRRSSRRYHGSVPDAGRLARIAAVAVVASHAPDVVAAWRPASAFLAVDFFFALSGFVIAHAYDERLGGRLSGFEFCRRRIIRLFPMYFVTSALAAIAVFVLHDANQWTIGTLITCVALAAVMLPSRFTPLLFPLNDASWSLFFEFVDNGVYATRV
jgi:peptidoglycan/LPS O-acetylase OafA/YrhL